MYSLKGNSATASSDKTSVLEDELSENLSIETAVLHKPKQEKQKRIRRTYIVKVPPHISPGEHFFANGTDGTRMLVTCPPFATPGMELKILAADDVIKVKA